eukprot:12548974-Ditylum_brightwellii.AAC.1
MPEINTPWKKQVQATCHWYGEKICGTFKCVGTSSNKTTIGMYQLGGVAIFGRGHIVERIKKVENDKRVLGHWSYCRLNGK